MKKAKRILPFLNCFSVALIVVNLSGCSAPAANSEDFSVSDFIENAMHQSAETVFDRYGWDLDAAKRIQKLSTRRPRRLPSGSTRFRRN